MNNSAPVFIHKFHFEPNKLSDLDTKIEFWGTMCTNFILDKPTSPYSIDDSVEAPTYRTVYGQLEIPQEISNDKGDKFYFSHVLDKLDIQPYTWLEISNYRPLFQIERCDLNLLVKTVRPIKVNLLKTLADLTPQPSNGIIFWYPLQLDSDNPELMLCVIANGIARHYEILKPEESREVSTNSPGSSPLSTSQLKDPRLTTLIDNQPYRQLLHLCQMYKPRRMVTYRNIYSEAYPDILTKTFPETIEIMRAFDKGNRNKDLNNLTDSQVLKVLHQQFCPQTSDDSSILEQAHEPIFSLSDLWFKLKLADVLEIRAKSLGLTVSTMLSSSKAEILSWVLSGETQRVSDVTNDFLNSRFYNSASPGIYVSPLLYESGNAYRAMLAKSDDSLDRKMATRPIPNDLIVEYIYGKHSATKILAHTSEFEGLIAFNRNYFLAHEDIAKCKIQSGFSIYCVLDKDDYISLDSHNKIDSNLSLTDGHNREIRQYLYTIFQTGKKSRNLDNPDNPVLTRLRQLPIIN